MEYFNIRDPLANQILVWSEIENAFINVDPSNNASSVTGGINISNQGSTIFQDVSAGNMRFRSILGGNGITLQDYNTYIEINFDGDASTLNGISASGFVLKNENLADINTGIARENLHVYSIDDAHDQFMETNASNIPDLDDTYDLGSNGRRYAGVYAKTFHGTATNASLSQQLVRNNAMDGQVLTWSNSNNRWIPATPTPITLSGAIDVYTDTLQDRSLLRYNANRNRWEPDNSEASGGSSSGGIADIENLGNGLGIYKDRTGFIANFRTLRAGDDISLNYNFNDEEIVISADVPNNTDELPEGNSNLYYTNARFDSRFTQSSVRNLSDVQGGTPSINQTLVWNGSSFTFRTVVVDVNSTDDIPEGTNNLYYTEGRVENVISNYFQTSGFVLDDLSDVNVVHENGNIIVSDGVNWVSSNLQLSMIDGVNISNISTGDVLVWNDAVNGLITTRLPTILFDLDETIDSEHFNDSSFNDKVSQITSDNVTEGNSNIYLRNDTLLPLLNNISINELIDVNTTNIVNNSGLRWDASASTFVVYDIPQNLIDLNETTASQHFNDSSFNDKVSQITSDNINEGSVNLYLNDTNYNQKFQNSSILDLTDVNGSSLSDGYVLSWDQSENEFIAVSIESLSSDISQLNDLTDVFYNVVEMGDGDLLVWDTNNNQFIRSTPITRIEELDNVITNNLSSNDILVFNGSNFVNEPNLPFELNSPSVNQLLLWDGTKFVNSNLADAGAIEIRTGDLQDVILDYDTVQTGDSLIWDDSVGSFVLGPSAQYIKITDINGMDIENIQDGDGIRWDGLSFTRTNLPLFNPQSFTDLSVMVYSTSESAFISSDIWTLLSIDNTDPQDGNVLIYNSIESVYQSRGLNFDDISGLNDPIETKVNNTNYVLRWSDVSNEFQIYEPRIIVDVFEDLDDVSFDNLQNGDFVCWDESNSTFTNKTISTDDLADLLVTDIQENETLYWNGSQFVNGNIPVSLLGLTDVNATNINNGEVLVWDLVAGEFTNTNIIRNLIQLEDVNFGISGIDDDNANQYSLLTWDTNSNAFISTLSTRKLQRTSFRYDEWFEPYTEIDPITEEEITIEPVIEYDFLDSTLSFHTRNVTADTEFKLLVDEIDEAHFLYFHLTNNDNYNVTFSAGEMVEVTDPEPGTEYQGQPIELLNQIDVTGETIICFFTLDGINWKGYEFIQPIGKSLPNISTLAVNDREIYVYNDANSQFEPKRLDTYDLIDFPEIRVDQSALIWNESTSQFDFKEFTLSNLSGFNIDTIVDGQYIIWDGVNSEFVNHTPSLSELEQVDFTGVSDSQVLAWNDINSQFENVSVNVEFLTDVTITNIQDGESLVWNNINGQWENTLLTYNVSDLNDVSITTIEDGQTLVWNDANSQWENTLLAYNVDDLNDVTLTSIQDGDILIWDNTNSIWVNQPNIDSLLDLNDVDNTLDSNQLLYWDGTQLTTTATVNNVELDNITYTLNTVPSSTIIPEDALYQTITPTADTTYTINDIIGLTGVYKFTMILDNASNFVIDFISQSGNIEYVGGVVANYNGKYLIEALTIDGVDWIFTVSDPIS